MNKKKRVVAPCPHCGADLLRVGVKVKRLLTVTIHTCNACHQGLHVSY